MLVDMSNRLVERINSFNADYIIQIFGIKILVGSRLNARASCHCAFVAADFNILFVKPCLNCRERLVDNFAVNNKTFASIAHTDALCFCVKNDICRHINIGCFINENVTVARTGFDNRNGWIFDNGFNESLAAARDKTVEIVGHFHHIGCRLTRSVLDKLNNILGKALAFDCIAHCFANRFVWIYSLFSASQNNGVAAFKTKRRGIGGNIRTGLKNNTDYANRHGDFFDTKSVILFIFINRFATLVLKFCNLQNTLCNAVDSLGIKHKAVKHTARKSAYFAVFKVCFICGNDFVLIFYKRNGDCAQRLVFIVGGCHW